MSMMELLSPDERASQSQEAAQRKPASGFDIILSDKCVEPGINPVPSAGFMRNTKKKSKRGQICNWRDMIIKIEAVPKLAVEDGVEKVVMGENNQPVWDKEKALITTNGRQLPQNRHTHG